MADISDIIGFGSYAENDEGQPLQRDSLINPIEMEILKNYKPTSVDIVNPNVDFTSLLMNDKVFHGTEPNHADDQYCRQCGEKRGESSRFCSNCGAQFG